MIIGNENEAENKNRSQRYDINRPRLGVDIYLNILKTKCFSV